MTYSRVNLPFTFGFLVNMIIAVSAVADDVRVKFSAINKERLGLSYIYIKIYCTEINENYI